MKLPAYFAVSPILPVVLTVSVAGVPAAPFFFSSPVDQMGGLVWMVP